MRPQPAAVHRAEDDLAVERPEQQQVLDDVGGAEDAVHAGPRRADDEPLEQLGPVGHRQRSVPARRARRAPGGRPR